MRRVRVAGYRLGGACAVWLICAVGLMAQQGGGGTDPAAPAAVDAGADEVPAAESMVPDDITVLYLLAMGGPLMYPLYLCSLLTVAFGIERAINLRRNCILPQPIVNAVRAVIADAGRVGAETLLNDLQVYPSPLSRVLSAGLRKAGHPLAEIEKAIVYAGDRENTHMRRNNRVLSVVAGVAPLLGLLGTVFGMIQAFITVAAHEEALGRTAMLAAGIYQAMVTTAVGLCIAIPCLVLYHVYAEKVDRLVSEMDDIATDLVDRLAED